ncbi:MAG: PilZ domain-containing protein [Polyangiaceae bacterium]|nr:PilZ domain-containing protein [Polyangiaceae bacterium]
MNSDKERRAGGPRIPLQTLVEIGANEDGTQAFEAEAIDITTGGMRLKTAYLPEVGRPLICRFEGAGTEVIAQAQVTWRIEDKCGGDFGVRFLEMDRESLNALRALAGEQLDDEPEEESSPDAPAVPRGARVRLHIEGLGAPMKARVRDAGRHEVLVGSNLEFLRVGRPIDLENVDSPSNRPARIDRVSVEIDPASHVPQLVVALRYLDVPEPEPAPPETRFSEDDSDSDEQPRLEQQRLETTPSTNQVLEETASTGIGASVWKTVKNVGPTLSVVGAAVQQWGSKAKSKAKDAMDDAVAAAKKKPTEKPGKRTAPPLRKTAPPPKSAYTKTGLRKQHAIPEDPIEDANAEEMAKTRKKRRLALVGIAAAAIFGGVVIANAAFGGNSDKPSRSSEAALLGDEDDQDAQVIPGEMGHDSNSSLVAEVPLFGPKPMSTSAPMAPMAALPVALPTVALPVIGNPPSVSIDDLPSDDEDDSADDSPRTATAGNVVDDDDDAPVVSAQKQNTPKATSKTPKKTAAGDPPKSFGRGKVSNPVVLTLRMNQKIKELRGAPQNNGFSVDIIGARGTEPAAGFRRQDSRIAESKVVNHGNNSQLTIRFKGSAPGYRVVAEGSTLRILIDGDKKTASSQTNRGRSR